MKILNTAIVAATLVFAAHSNAAIYEFIPTDNSDDTKLCVNAAKDKKSKLMRQISKLNLTRVYVANTVECNDKNITLFAEQYGATKVFSFLNKYKRIPQGSVTIKEISEKPE
ncbi:DUF3718 domain-containing protein [Flocculibacter collagenilyticus]|uniref:DUF3718 domain-containing protein n=1 Tax=Flocculibacter collagenilyticus TaxID=2744479 RepID=UPI0018F39B8F|nr:DUF3718 domain-containing protein [Flocculibacter collagenilyticus]